MRKPIKVDTCGVSMIQSVSVEKRGEAGGEIIGEEGTGVMQVARREHAQEAFFKHSCSTHRKHAPTLQQQAHRLRIRQQRTVWMLQNLHSGSGYWAESHARGQAGPEQSQNCLSGASVPPAGQSSRHCLM